MADIHGIDTIRGLAGEPPAEIPIPYKVMKAEQLLMSQWNEAHIAVIPFCYKCKVALIWHTPPEQNELFTCPNCGRVWVKGEGWND